MSRGVIRKLSPWLREVRPTSSLAMPIIGGMVSQMLMGLADTIMVGRIGVVPLAAASFVNTITHLPFVFSLGLLSAVAVLTAQAYGAGEKYRVGEVLRHGVFISFIAGLLTVVGMIAVKPYLHWFGQPKEVIEASKTYLILFAISIIPALVSHGCKQVAEALNQPWVPTFILLGGVLANVFFNWILIYGNWGAPAMGLEGAGWATILARLLMAIAMILFVTRGAVLRSFQPSRWWAALHVSELKQLLNIGWPVAAQHLLEVSAFAFAALMMGWISADAIAAHQIAISCAATSFMFALGLGMAICIRVGQTWGAGKYQRMRRIGFLGLVMAALIMGFFAIVYIVARELLAGAFVNVESVILLAAQLLMVAAIFQVADGLQVAAISALRGLSDVRVPALIAILAYWVVAVPLGYFMGFTLGMGAVGIWIGLAIGLGVAAFCLSWRFHTKSRSVARERTRPSTTAIAAAH